MTDRATSITHCGKVLAAVTNLRKWGFPEDEKVSTELIVMHSGLTEKQVIAAIETMTHGRHPQVDGDRNGVYRINDIRHTY